jgi:hypothetical protein
MPQEPVLPKPPKKKSRALYRFDLKSLEDSALAAYAAWESEDSDVTRTQLFLRVKDLAFAVCSVGKYRNMEIDFDEVAHEYSLYLFRRIVIKGFKLHGVTGRFPLQHYMRKNILRVLFDVKDSHKKKNDHLLELVEDLEFFVDSDPSVQANDNMHVETQKKLVSRSTLASKLFLALRLYYKDSEIRRLLPLASELIFADPHSFINDKLPTDLKDFTIVLIAQAKTICTEDNIHFGMNVKKKDLSRALAASVRSTVFLSTVINSEFFPRELLLTLDFDSLYRLVSCFGGKTIRIPNQQVLDSMLGATIVASKYALTGKMPARSIAHAKQEFDLVFTAQASIQHFVSKALEVFQVHGHPKSSEPMINILSSSVAAMDMLFQKIKDNPSEVSSSEAMSQYVKLSESFSKLSQAICALNQVATTPDASELSHEHDAV